MIKGYQSNTVHKDVPQRYVEPAVNLIYAVLLQAVVDNDREFLKSDDGRAMYKFVRKQREKGE